MKKVYISPTAEILDVQMDHKFCMGSNNITTTGTGQEGPGENGNNAPGTGGNKTPIDGERGAKSFNLWDDEDEEE